MTHTYALGFYVQMWGAVCNTSPVDWCLPTLASVLPSYAAYRLRSLEHDKGSQKGTESNVISLASIPTKSSILVWSFR